MLGCSVYGFQGCGCSGFGFRVLEPWQTGFEVRFNLGLPEESAFRSRNAPNTVRGLGHVIGVCPSILWILLL